MSEPGSIDWVLSTTRTVRRRLDLDRPVDLQVVRECLELALQAPTGGDFQGWRWIVVTDPAVKKGVRATLPRRARNRRPEGGGRVEVVASGDRMLDGAWHLATNLDRVPVLVVACIKGGLTPTAPPPRPPPSMRRSIRPSGACSSRCAAAAWSRP